MNTMLHLRPRYYCLFADPGQVDAEKNFHYQEREWTLLLSEGALVIVDVWNIDYAVDRQERFYRVVTDRIVPLVTVCRDRGFRVIHAPAEIVAEKHPQRYHPTQSRPPDTERDPEWPPADTAAKYGPLPDSREAMRLEWIRRERNFHPAVFPCGDEPVIASGNALHDFCKDHRIRCLFYVGFCTNACVINRTYGISPMKRRGYAVALVRDCTSGLETHETLAPLTCTQGAIATLEQQGTYTLTASQLISALQSQ